MHNLQTATDGFPKTTKVMREGKKYDPNANFKISTLKLLENLHGSSMQNILTGV